MIQQPSYWREDLEVNSRQRGLLAPILAWILDPGFACVTLIRLATMPRRNVMRKIVARWAARRLAYRFGCYISVEARIGRRLVLPHPVGIVIGENCEVGDDVTIYQHVTLGRRVNNVSQYPIIGDGAVLYAGAVVLGGVFVGSRTAIGANAVVLHDIPAESSAGGVPARILRSQNSPEKESTEALVTSPVHPQPQVNSRSTATAIEQDARTLR